VVGYVDVGATDSEVVVSLATTVIAQGEIGFILL